MSGSIFDRVASLTGAGVGSAAKSAFVSRVGGKYAGALGKALNGDIGGALRGLASGELSKLIGKASSRNQLFGGLSLRDAEAVMAECNATDYSRKNVFFIEIKDPNPPDGDISHLFNLLATEVSFSPFAVVGSPQEIGMAVLDRVTATERVEIKITTFDDAQGSIKSWFAGKCAQVANTDGTVGLPADYVFGIRIVQAASDLIGETIFGGYRSEFKVRAGSIECESSRNEDGMEQLQMTFIQFDTFMT